MEQEEFRRPRKRDLVLGIVLLMVSAVTVVLWVQNPFGVATLAVVGVLAFAACLTVTLYALSRGGETALGILGPPHTWTRRLGWYVLLLLAYIVGLAAWLAITPDQSGVVFLGLVTAFYVLIAVGIGLGLLARREKRVA